MQALCPRIDSPAISTRHTDGRAVAALPINLLLHLFSFKTPTFDAPNKEGFGSEPGKITDGGIAPPDGQNLVSPLIPQQLQGWRALFDA